MNHKLFHVIFTLTAFFSMSSFVMPAPAKFASVANLALYKGPNRQQILEEGARKEGKLVFYTSSIWAPPLAHAFQKKYPYIKVQIWRAGGEQLMPKVLEEYNAGKYLFDVIEVTQGINWVLKGAGITQSFYSPELSYIEEGAIAMAEGGGVLEAPFRTSGIGLGYNNTLITKDQFPKTYRDLLNPKWKGKMAIAGSDTGVMWVGTLLENYGMDFVRQISKQELAVHMVSGKAILDMIINGEYALSPTIFDSHIVGAREKGAPVDWVPLEPVHVNVGLIALPKRAPNPHAALLFIDFELSKEGAEINKAGGYNPMRKDVPPLMKAYKKFYGAKSLDEVKKWNEHFNNLFLNK